MSSVPPESREGLEELAFCRFLTTSVIGPANGKYVTNSSGATPYCI